MGLFDDLLPQQSERPAIPAAGRALLDTIAGSESPDYNTMYGGGRFEGYQDHPRKAVPITTGPNVGKTSSAAGRYQFLGSTWDEVKREAGLPDFSPESQDAGAWHLANKTYKSKTGRDLAGDLEKAQGNPQAIAGIGKYLSGVWTSLPGGIEPNRATGSFAQRYASAQPPTDMSGQRRTGGLFDDLLPATTTTSPQPTSPPAEALPNSTAEPGGRFTDNPGQNFRVAREGVSEAAPPKTGAGEALARGAATGVTANFYDELRGLMEAGGLDPKDPASLGALLKGAYSYWTGDPEAAKRYQAGAGREREITQRAEADQPVASIVGSIAGGVALPLGTALQAPTMGARAVRSAAVGAGFGAASGAGEGVGAGDSVSRAASGAALGGAIGGAASPVLDVVARGGGRAVQEAGRYLFPNVEQRAAGMVQNAAQSAQRVDPGARTRLLPAEAAATPQSAVADITGEPGRAIARWAANVSPEARETLNAMVDPRYAGQAERVVGWLERTFHYPEATAQREAIRLAGEAVNNPNYARAMQDGARGVWNPELQRLAGAPAIQQAAREAIPSLSNRSITEGFRAPRQNPLTTGPDGRVSLTALPNGNQIVPDLRFWDQVKRGIDAQIGKAEAQGNRAKVDELTGLNNHLIAQLDLAVPTYGAARAGAAHFFGARDALQAGQEFVRGNMPIAEARRNLARMTANERQLFQDGFVSRYIQDLSKVGDSRNILNKVAESPAARQKLNLVLGPQRANELEAMLRIEGVMNLTRSHTQGNSTTARQLVELGAVGSYGGVSAYQTDPQSIAQSLLLGAFVARGRNTDQRVARRVAEMLVSHNPAVFQRGLNMVARNQRLMDGIRGLDQRIARVGGQQSTGVPALQSLSIGRAEEDDPNVPRPPGQ
jgi:muramidase (phage lysozyme)